MKNPSKVLYAGKDDDGKRIDRILQQALPQLSRSNIFRALRKGLITINKKKIKPDTRIRNGDAIQIFFLIQNTSEIKKENKIITDFDISRIILFQDKNIIAVNKPRGMATHGLHSIEQYIVQIWQETNSSSLSFKPGPLHRLDRNTTGIVFFSFSIKGARLFSTFFKNRKIKKIYVGIADNKMKKIQIWQDFLYRNRQQHITKKSLSAEGKEAVTKVIPIAINNDLTLALFIPKTGRTHQIRSQAGLHGFPLSGDKKYSGSSQIKNYILHAAAIHLESTEYKLPDIIAPLPPPAEKIVSQIFGNNNIKKLYSSIREELLNNEVFS